MEVVMDTSGIIAIALNEPNKPVIIQQTQGAILYGPLSLEWEVGNALTAMLKRGRLNLLQATAGIQQYRQIPIKLMEVDLSQSVALASAHNIYAYDAYMIACALKLNFPLLSLDQRLLNAAASAGVAVIRI